MDDCGQCVAAPDPVFLGPARRTFRTATTPDAWCECHVAFGTVLQRDGPLKETGFLHTSSRIRKIDAELRIALYRLACSPKLTL